uniref:Amphi-Trp domain-containing protein n=1 Tax=Nitratidesulfovibrio vulgaris (strain DSM 19637 / Miyazaki F) TaxID=883 RepID=B8DP03_NITV9
MTQYGKRTVQFSVTPEEAPGLVRRIGEQMADGVITLEGRSIEIDGFESIGISLKRTGDKLRARVKVKFPKRPGEVGSDADDSDGDDD